MDIDNDSAKKSADNKKRTGETGPFCLQYGAAM